MHLCPHIQTRSRLGTDDCEVISPEDKFGFVCFSKVDQTLLLLAVIISSQYRRDGRSREAVVKQLEQQPGCYLVYYHTLF